MYVFESRLGHLDGSTSENNSNQLACLSSSMFNRVRIKLEELSKLYVPLATLLSTPSHPFLIQGLEKPKIILFSGMTYEGVL